MKLTIVDSRHGRPELLLQQPRQWIGGRLSCIGSVPLSCQQIALRMRRVLEHVHIAGLLALLDSGDFSTDRDQSVAESVEFGLVFGFCGLDHERVGDGPGHGRGMETVILKTFGNVDGLNAARLLEVTCIEDEFVRTSAVGVCVEDWVVVLETSEDVVCIQESDLGGMCKTLGAHHVYVIESDGKETGTTPGSSANWG